MKVSLKISSCILSEVNFEAKTIKRSGQDEFVRPRLLVLAQRWGLYGALDIDMMA